MFRGDVRSAPPGRAAPLEYSRTALRLRPGGCLFFIPPERRDESPGSCTFACILRGNFFARNHTAGRQGDGAKDEKTDCHGPGTARPSQRQGRARALGRSVPALAMTGQEAGGSRTRPYGIPPTPAELVRAVRTPPPTGRNTARQVSAHPHRDGARGGRLLAAPTGARRNAPCNLPRQTCNPPPRMCGPSPRFSSHATLPPLRATPPLVCAAARRRTKLFVIFI